MNIILGSTSDLKKWAIRQVLEQHKTALALLYPYRILCFDVESLVPDTPYDEQTFDGAMNRARALFEAHAVGGDLYVGLESGLVKRNDRLFEECWCCIIDKTGQDYVGYSSGLLLPAHVVNELQLGNSHVGILKRLAEEIGMSSKDTWSIYSRGALARTESIKEAFRNAVLSIN